MITITVNVRAVPVSATNTGGASLVFLQPMNRSATEHLQLLKRVFHYCQKELLTTHRAHSSSSSSNNNSSSRCFYIVTDVGPTVRMPTLRGMLAEVANIQTQVYAGAKPMFSPISCVVICLACN